MSKAYLAICFVLFVALDSAFTVEWVGPERNATTARLTLTKKFSLNKDLPRYIRLRIATDFCSAQVLINGRRVHTANQLGTPIAVEVHRFCRSGDNVVTVELSNAHGPSAIALQIADEDGHKLLTSDRSWTMSSGNLQSFGSVEEEPWWRVSRLPATNAFDEYNQWKEPSGDGIDDSRLQLSKEFDPLGKSKIEVAHRAKPGPGTWICMAVDDKGRLYCGREDAGIDRVEFRDGKAVVERVNEDLKGCHGLLWSKGSLFATASNSKALYRLTDSTGDDQIDEVVKLRYIPGGGGDHGRNDLIEGPDGSIFLICGDSVDVPDNFTSRVPMTREFAENDTRPKGGHVIRTDRDGQTWEVFASGLRNPYGIAINGDDELFTYDADSEKHVGLSYYRPTRMNHLVAGTDYGWRSRNGEIPLPLHLPDMLPPNVLIGRGSPTSARFGWQIGVAGKYQNALFTADWAFGRLFAVHVVPCGATYSMHPETILRGQPLNLVDIEHGPPGETYLLTGGRKTQSIIYKLTYSAAPWLPPQTPQIVAREKYSLSLRTLRRELEGDLSGKASAVEFCWKHLSHPDRWIRNAARVGLERLPVETWQSRIWSETDHHKSLIGLLALARIAKTLDADQVSEQLGHYDFSALDVDDRLVMMRTLQWIDEYHEAVSIPDSLVAKLAKSYPTGDVPVDRDLCSFLIRNDSTQQEQVVGATLDILATEIAQTDAMHFLEALSHANSGWQESTRDEYFRLLQAANLYRGDEFLSDVVRGMRERALPNVPNETRAKYASLVKFETPEVLDAPPREHVQDWALADFAAGSLRQLDGDLQRGEKVFRQAQCASCHRHGGIGRSYGPDLTGVAARFTRREILRSILEPSETISSQYENHIVLLNDGRTLTGQVAWDGFRKSLIKIATDPLRMDQLTEVSKHDIESRSPSPTSPMPAKLLDTFERGDIADLLAFLENGG